MSDRVRRAATAVVNIATAPTIKELAGFVCLVAAGLLVAVEVGLVVAGIGLVLAGNVGRD